MSRITPIWKDQDVWIIGGGASIAKQFGVPTHLRQGVLEGSQPVSVYSEYMQALYTKNTIGVNAAYLIGDWIKYILFHDEEFWQAHKKRLEHYPGQLVTCNNRFETRPHERVLFIPKSRVKGYGISEDASTLCWNHNSGAAAISLAAHLGARKIFLLGFDMNIQGSVHFHNAHKDYLKRTPPFERFLLGFPYIAQDAKRRGIEIFNCSPESAIDVFPKVNVKDVLK